MIDRPFSERLAEIREDVDAILDHDHEPKSAGWWYAEARSLARDAAFLLAQLEQAEREIAELHQERARKSVEYLGYQRERDEALRLLGEAREEIARLLRKARPAPRVTHGRHCPCTACRREDWTRPDLGPCGMHGPECPPVYAPITGDSP